MTAPGGTTGALLTTSVHWIRQTKMNEDAESLARRLSLRFAWEVERWDSAHHGYSHTLVVGPLRVWHHPDRPDMGVCIDASGEACEQIGVDGVAWLLGLPGWKQTRVDVALDGVPFEPALVRDAWRGGDVRTAARLPKVAQAGREGWRTSRWLDDHTGDMFTMGARQSGQFVRCYNRRGFTRLELEVKGDAAPAAAAMLAAALVDRDELAFGQIVVGLLRRFVDFVDASADANISRCPLLPWWAEVAEGVDRCRLWLGEVSVKSAGDMLEWALAQTAPVLAVLERVFGPAILRDLAAEGRVRWKRRHREAVRLAGVA